MFQRTILGIVLMLSLVTIGVSAQQAVVSSGGNISSSSGSMSYSVGQIVCGSVTGSTGKISQGVQLPYEISIVSAIPEINGNSINCTLLPNPTSDFVLLKITFPDNTKFSYQLYDINGKLLENRTDISSETRISMGQFPPSSYFLTITNKNQKIKTFKIIKR